MQHNSKRMLLLSGFILVSFYGCAPVALTLFGVGAGVTTGTAVSYTMDGVAYRTLSAPLAEVETAALAALDHMGIKVDKTERTDEGKSIKASGFDRQIEVELQVIGSRTTRIRSVAKDGVFFKDRATATEIILQTESILNRA